MEIVLGSILVLFGAFIIAYINISRKLKVVSLGFMELLASTTKINEFSIPQNIIEIGRAHV